jgi:hypothetical protein
MNLQAVPAHTLLASFILTALPFCLSWGGIERVCPGCPNNPQCELDERWSSSVNLPWSIKNSTSGANVFIAAAWSTGSCVGTTLSQARGYSSTVSGMLTWNDLFYKHNTTDPAPRADEQRADFLPSEITSPLANYSVNTVPTPSTTLTFDGCVSPNVVTFQQSASFWLDNGGDATLAISDVCPNSSSLITGADIAINTTNNAWGMVEWETPVDDPNPNDSSQRVFVTTTSPSMGFADIRGILAHEAGHFGGMGHTVVDSTANPNASRFPTMFNQGQARGFSATAVLCSGLTQSINGRIVGLSARDLEVDDIAGLSRAYPSATFASETAQITGMVELVGGHERGVSIVAMSKDDPSALRAGTLTRRVSQFLDTNEYVLSGLPRGQQLYLYAELVDRPGDQPNSGWSFPDYYFPDGFSLPNYSFPEFGGCSLPSINLDSLLPAFYYSGSCVSLAPKSTASVLDMTSVSSLSNINFVCQPGGPSLRVRRGAMAHASSRGQRVSVGETVTFEITNGLSPTTLYIAPVLENSLIFNQLRQVKVYTNKPYPTGWPHKVELGTNTTFSWTIPAGQGKKNFYAQALCGNDYSNVVNVWVE